MTRKAAPAMRVGLLGAGTIAGDVASGLLKGVIPGAVLVAVLTRSNRHKIDGVNCVGDLQALINLKPDVVAECAGADAFAAHVPSLLAAGIDVVAVSMTAMARTEVDAAHRDQAQRQLRSRRNDAVSGDFIRQT